MVFNNGSSFQQQAGASSRPQSVGRIFPNDYQEPLEFHPNSKGQYNGMLQYQPQSSFYQPLSLPQPSFQPDGCVRDINSVYSGDPKHGEGQVKLSSDERGLLSEAILLPSRPKKSKGNPKIRFVYKRRELEIHKVLYPLPVPENRDNVHGECNAFNLAEHKVLLIHPPIPLILKALRKFKREGKEAVLVVPDWKGQIWTRF
jgi:hypothetical protein